MLRLIEGTVVLLFLIATIWVALHYIAPIPLINENKEFAGALIAAAGTIFAGWLAWSAVREQIDFSREQLAVQEKQAQFWQKQTLQTEIAAIRNAINYVAKLENAAKELRAGEPRPYVSALRRVYTAGNLGSFMGNTPPGELGSRVQQLSQRLMNIVNQASNWIQRREQVDASVKAGGTGLAIPSDDEIEQYEAAAKDAVNELSQLHRDLIAALEDRKKGLANMP